MRARTQSTRLHQPQLVLVAMPLLLCMPSGTRALPLHLLVGPALVVQVLVVGLCICLQAWAQARPRTQARV
jgi:hypothetical protein